MGLPGSELGLSQGGGAGRRKLGPGEQAIPGLGWEAKQGGREGMRARTCLSTTSGLVAPLRG